MKRIPAIALLILAAMLGAPSGATAEPRVGVEFSKDEIRIIAAWYDDHGAHDRGKAGKKKGGSLPPGIAKNLSRGKALPPGIAKQYLPDGLERLLPPAPRGYERIVLDGKILLVEVATRIIHDVLLDAVK